MQPINDEPLSKISAQKNRIDGVHPCYDQPLPLARIYTNSAYKAIFAKLDLFEATAFDFVTRSGFGGSHDELKFDYVIPGMSIAGDPPMYIGKVAKETSHHLANSFSA